jgi:hypothetical protein
MVMYDSNKAAGFFDEEDPEASGYSTFLNCMEEA